MERLTPKLPNNREPVKFFTVILPAVSVEIFISGAMTEIAHNFVLILWKYIKEIGTFVSCLLISALL